MTAMLDNMTQVAASHRLIALVGHANVGKSVLFHRLTGRYTPVANFPGTTVEVARGDLNGGLEATLLDTPGVVTFPATTEEEQVTARILLEGELDGVIQVGDAKNLRRTLLLCLSLIEMGIPLALALNMIDEAERSGIALAPAAIEEHLGIPVIPTAAVLGTGVDALRQVLGDGLIVSPLRMRYASAIELAADELEPLLPTSGLRHRALALLWLGRDPSIEVWLLDHVSQPNLDRMRAIRDRAEQTAFEPIEASIHRSRLSFIEALFPNPTEMPAAPPKRRLGPNEWTTHPILGLPLLAAVLFGLYYFVGVFGAGTVVDWLEGTVFGAWLNPLIIGSVERLIPVPWLADLLVGPYGLWTVGITYAVALILPIVTTFFLAFAVLEDSGYFPRLSVLTNRAFRSIGLNGRAVLPMILGLGCVTMATMSTRVLESRRDRLLVILLLALAIPCSAQLGIVMGMLASISLGATLLWGLVVLLVLVAVGWLAARLLPGEPTPLLVELPPLRRPQLSNVLIKTAARLEWYMREVIPLFLIGALVMFGLDRTGLLDWLIASGQPLVTGWLGLPSETSAALVMGFLRRDFGATGLFLMGTSGLLTANQTIVAMVTVTLFVPCVASVLVIARERGWRPALAITAVIFPLAFLIGGLLHRFFLLTGWTL